MSEKSFFICSLKSGFGKVALSFFVCSNFCLEKVYASLFSSSSCDPFFFMVPFLCVNFDFVY